jgi:hypothetical protein
MPAVRIAAAIPKVTTHCTVNGATSGTTAESTRRPSRPIFRTPSVPYANASGTNNAAWAQAAPRIPSSETSTISAATIPAAHTALTRARQPMFPVPDSDSPIIPTIAWPTPTTSRIWNGATIAFHSSPSSPGRAVGARTIAGGTNGSRIRPIIRRDTRVRRATVGRSAVAAAAGNSTRPTCHDTWVSGAKARVKASE